MILAILLVTSAVVADWWFCLPDEAVANYTGRQTCVQCHQEQHTLWSGSHHDLAMDRATAETVLGDFDDQEVSHYGVTSRLYKDGERFMIHTEGPDGEMGDFEIKYVFGVDPLQQYMVEFDRAESTPADEIARLQVLRVSWDTEQQQWFYLSPPDVDEKLASDDDLHWTGIAQRWNNMCADCHSTNLQKNFNSKTRRYHTTFSEIDVSCEACHGPGSLHVELANQRSLFWDRKLGYGLANLKDKDTDIEIHTCAQCHSRRRIVHPDYRPGQDFYDFFANELLQEHTYHADGQILDEVYVHGSFIQSRMYHKGIRCTDCHDPHTARLKHNGNAVCTSCHEHSAGKYDSPSHHRHDPTKAGASCVECHMPETTYMAVDPRRDHSLRVPRPDLSVQYGTPNACSRCHLDRAKLPDEKRSTLQQYNDWVMAARDGDEEVARSLAELDQWSADHAREWWGDRPQSQPRRLDHYAEILAPARRGDAESAVRLVELARNRRYPAIVRATSLLELGQFNPAQYADSLQSLLRDPAPQVRAAAVANAEALPPDREFIKLVAPLLSDPSRVVRAEAGRVLSRVPRQRLNNEQDKARRAAIEEFKAGLAVSNDRAAAHLTLAILHENLGDTDAARQAYETAMAVEPNMSGPRTNLAALHDRLAEAGEREVQRLLRVDRPRAEQLLGEMFVHRKKAQELRAAELPLLARDAELAPEIAAVQYRYGLSLYLHDRKDEARAALERSVELEPNAADFVLAMALFHKKYGEFRDAIRLTKRLLELRPNDPTYLQMLAELEQQAKRPVGPAPPGR